MNPIEVMKQALQWFEWFHAGNTITAPLPSSVIKKNLKEILESEIDPSHCIAKLKTELNKLNSNLTEVEHNCYKDSMLLKQDHILHAGGMPPEVEEMRKASR